MSVKIIFQQIEIGFWDVFISLMHKSTFLRFFVPRVYRLYQTKEIQKTITLILAMILLGLTTGLMIGAISQI